MPTKEFINFITALCDADKRIKEDYLKIIASNMSISDIILYELVA